MRVNTSRGDTGALCLQSELEDSYLYNDGRGIFLEDGKATIDFCSDDDRMVGLASEPQTFIRRA